MKKNSSLFFRYQKYLFPFIDKSIISLACAGISVVLAMALPLITKVLIDYAYPNKDLFLLTTFILIGLLIFFIRQHFDSTQGYLDMYIHQKLAVDIKHKFYEKLQSLSLKFHHEKQAGDLIFRATDDIDAVVEMVAETIAISIQTFAELGFLLFITLRFDWRLTLLALSGLPLYFLETKIFVKRLRDVRERVQKKESDIMSTLQEKIPTIKAIKIFGREKFEVEIFLRKLKERFLLGREGHIVGLLNVVSDSTIRTIWLTGLTWYAGYHVITGVLSIGEVVVMVAFIFRLYGPLMTLGDIYRFIIRGLVSAGRVSEVLEKEVEIKDAPDALELKEVRGAVAFEDVSFGYYPDDYILRNVSFSVSPGMKIAIVGVSGVGKTSLIDLISRLYDPIQGKITVDGYDLRKVKLSSIKNHVSIVSQEVVIFRGTIKENILYGKSDATMDEIIEASKLANAHEFISNMPNGYDTMLDERGTNISAGQRQRISLARSFIRNPKILILDEATAAVDAESEAYIYEALLNFGKGRTIISIAHRLSTVIDADLILVLEEGKISETGKFEELVGKAGAFYHLYQLQFSDFHYFSQRLSEEIKRTKRYRVPFSIMMIEIDNLVDLVASYNEQTVDALEREVESLIQRKIREVDFSAHYQKDRFLIALPGTKGEGALQVAERINKVVSESTFFKDVKDIKVTVSIGISTFGEDANKIDELYVNSQKALLVARKSRSNRCFCFSDIVNKLERN